MYRNRKRHATINPAILRSIAAGMLPTNDDIMKVVSNGIRWSARLGRGDLSESKRRKLVQLFRTFSPRDANDIFKRRLSFRPNRREVVNWSPGGRQLYRDSDCAKGRCERGDGKGIPRNMLGE